MSSSKCITTAALGVFVLFFNYGHCFDLNKINGTWIVGYTSNQTEASNCPFVNINATSKGNYFTYTSNKTNFTLKISPSNTRVHNVTGSKGTTGNLTIITGKLPFYIIVGLKLPEEIKNWENKENSTSYLVLTGRQKLPMDQDKNITELMVTKAELKGLRRVMTSSAECVNYYGAHVKFPTVSYPNVDDEDIVWAEPFTTTMKPMTTTPAMSTKKPNAAAGLYASELAFLISMLLLCAQ